MGPSASTVSSSGVGGPLDFRGGTYHYRLLGGFLLVEALANLFVFLETVLGVVDQVRQEWGDLVVIGVRLC